MREYETNSKKPWKVAKEPHRKWYSMPRKDKLWGEVLYEHSNTYICEIDGVRYLVSKKNNQFVGPSPYNKEAYPISKTRKIRDET